MKDYEQYNYQQMNSFLCYHNTVPEYPVYRMDLHDIICEDVSERLDEINKGLPMTIRVDGFAGCYEPVDYEALCSFYAAYIAGIDEVLVEVVETESN